MIESLCVFIRLLLRRSKVLVCVRIVWVRLTRCDLAWVCAGPILWGCGPVCERVWACMRLHMNDKLCVRIKMSASENEGV